MNVLNPKPKDLLFGKLTIIHVVQPCEMMPKKDHRHLPWAIYCKLCSYLNSIGWCLPNLLLGKTYLVQAFLPLLTIEIFLIFPPSYVVSKLCLLYLLFHISPQVRLNMNEKKPSKSQFNFPTLLGPCSMLKKLSKKIS